MTYPQYAPIPPKRPSTAGFWVAGGLAVAAFMVFVFTVLGLVLVGDGKPSSINTLYERSSSSDILGSQVTSRTDVDEDGNLVIWASTSTTSLSCRAVDSLGRNRATSNYDTDLINVGGRTWFKRYTVDVPDDEHVVITCRHDRYITVGWSKAPHGGQLAVAAGGFGLGFLLAGAAVVVGAVTLVRRTGH